MSDPRRDPRVDGLGRECTHTLAVCGQLRAMSIRSSVPALLWWLFWVLVAILLLILAALVVHHFGGFDLSFHVGYFHFLLGVSG
jgi:hypothetical protein